MFLLLLAQERDLVGKSRRNGVQPWNYLLSDVWNVRLVFLEVARSDAAYPPIFLVTEAQITAVRRPNFTELAALNPFGAWCGFAIIVARTHFALITEHNARLTLHINRLEPLKFTALLNSNPPCRHEHHSHGTLSFSFSHGCVAAICKTTEINPQITIDFIIMTVVTIAGRFIQSINVRSWKGSHRRMHGNWQTANIASHLYFNLCISHFLSLSGRIKNSLAIKTVADFWYSQINRWVVSATTMSWRNLSAGHFSANLLSVFVAKARVAVLLPFQAWLAIKLRRLWEEANGSVDDTKR